MSGYFHVILISLHVSLRIDPVAFRPKRLRHATHPPRSNQPVEKRPPFQLRYPKTKTPKHQTSGRRLCSKTWRHAYQAVTTVLVQNTARNASLIQGPARASIVPRNVGACHGAWAQGRLRGLSRGVQLALLLNEGPGVEGWVHMSVTEFWEAMRCWIREIKAHQFLQQQRLRRFSLTGAVPLFWTPW